jgi:hypothetical protein
MTMPKKASDRSDPPDQTASAQPSLETLARQWRAAADQVFTAALHDPQVYIRATRLVGAVAAHLRALGRGAAPLIAAWGRHREIVLRVAADDDLLTTDGVDLTAVAAAAFAMRHREVAHEIAVDARREAMSRLPSAAWSVLEEHGHAHGDPFIPYRRIEVHPATGRALLVTTAPDESYSACTHHVERLVIDVPTGEITALEDGQTIGRQFASESEREAHVAELKAHNIPVTGFPGSAAE